MASGEKLNTDFADLNWYKTTDGACMANGVYVIRRVKSDKSGFWKHGLVEKQNPDFTDLNWYKRQQKQSLGRARPNVFSSRVSYKTLMHGGKKLFVLSKLSWKYDVKEGVFRMVRVTIL